MATEEGEMWDDMMLGRMNGNRWTRRPRTIWLDTVKDGVLDCQMEKKLPRLLARVGHDPAAQGKVNF